jgi:hypothetical protein
MFTFRPLDDLILFLDYLLGVIAYSAEVTRLGVIDLDAEVRALLTTKADIALTWSSLAP